MRNWGASPKTVELRAACTTVPSPSKFLTPNSILVYSRPCCNVFKDLRMKAGRKMRLRLYERPGANLVFEASSSYKNMYDEFFII